jgi:CDC-like kinase
LQCNKNSALFPYLSFEFFHFSQSKVAIKVIKSEDRYVDSAKLEINVLKKIRYADKTNDHSCIALLDEFMYKGHPCLTFPILGKSTYDFQKDNDYRPFKFRQVLQMGFQLIKAVKFLHDMKLTHTDLKPENILFEEDSYDEAKSRSGRTVKVIRNCNIKLIDFGSATFEDERKTRIVATRHYRPPEVILELGWSHPCDVWSIGCILFEWYMGICMFQTHSNTEHLAMMERILGPFPDKLIRNSKKEKKFFRKRTSNISRERSSSRSHQHFNSQNGDYNGYRVDWDWYSDDGRYVRENCKPLDRYNQDRGDKMHNYLFGLLKVMLDYDPKRRITLAEALRHKFIKPQYDKHLDNLRRFRPEYDYNKRSDRDRR